MRNDEGTLNHLLALLMMAAVIAHAPEIPAAIIHAGTDIAITTFHYIYPRN